MNWQPIESAPINKTILIWCARMNDILIADVELDGQVVDINTGYAAKRPTHWMPLPEPPTS